MKLNNLAKEARRLKSKIEFEECSLKREFEECKLKIEFEEISLKIEFEENQAFLELVEALNSEASIWKQISAQALTLSVFFWYASGPGIPPILDL